MKTLGLLFGSEARVKVMRLFLFNPETYFDIGMICQKSKVNQKNVKREILTLEKANLIKKRSFFKAIKKKKRGKMVEIKKRTKGYYLNSSFSYLTSLKQLLMSTKTFEDEKIVRSLSRAGKLKFITVAGVFIQDKDSRLDMLIVGNNVNKTALSNAIKQIEAELGSEIVYAYFENPDFEYRLSMNDKLVRDVLDYPHKVLLDRSPS